jgi:hypothetical protein
MAGPAPDIVIRQVPIVDESSALNTTARRRCRRGIFVPRRTIVTINDAVVLIW